MNEVKFPPKSSNSRNSLHAERLEVRAGEASQRYVGLAAILVSIRVPLLIVAHTAIFSLVYWIAYCLRFDFNIPREWQDVFWISLPWLLSIQLICFLCFRTFNGWWRYFTFRDLVSLSYPLFLSFLIFGFLDLLVFEIHIPRGVHILNVLVAGLMIGGLRSIWRMSKEGIWAKRLPEGCQPAFIICNHNDSAILAHQINNRFSSKVRIVGILSDHPDIVGVDRAGMRVLGSPIDAPELANGRGVEQVWAVAGDVDGRELNQLKKLYDANGLALKVIPQTLDLESANGRIPLREIDINDLLQRDPVELDTNLIASELEGKRVLITGAGGSIGSELCRQIIQFRPSDLVLVDHRENSVFMIHHELSRVIGAHTRLHPAVGDILDESRMRMLFESFQPDFVYHAAAHKHVGLMEINSGEAIKNNILGTRRVAELAHEFGVQKFVQISTDKAVNPTSIMGCTKNIAERFVLALAQKSDTSFVVVRFGNVLGSNGSVVPLFKEQIARGGPVTLTDERMTRFFMTIPEASQLVLQAASMGQGGEIFVLDMGEQVLILDLAKTLIHLSGLPEDSIEIEMVGIRPGEKLYEELHIDPDQLLETDHPKINSAWQTSEPVHEVCAQIDELMELAYQPSSLIRDKFKTLIPEYQDDARTNGITAADRRQTPISEAGQQ